MNTQTGGIFPASYPRWAQSFENIQRNAFQKLMGLSGNTTSVDLLIILSSHKCILSTEAMSDTGRGTGDTVGTKTSVTGKVP